MNLATTLLLLTVLAPDGPPAAAPEKLTEHTLRRAKAAAPAPGKLTDLVWLSGRWIGEGLGGQLEEVWTAPDAGAMIGMFRFIREGKPIFYEILTLGEFDGHLAMRLKHVNPDMTGWEEKKDFVEFRWVGTIDGVRHFSGLAFKPEGGDAMTIYLALKGKDGTMREEVLKMRRAPE